MGARCVPYRTHPVPIWHLNRYVGATGGPERVALIGAQVQASGVLVQMLGGPLFLPTFYTAVRTMRHTQEGRALSREQLRVSQEERIVSREGQITERFTKAIEQLGDERLEVRLDGIYALERIARDSCSGQQGAEDLCRDHWAVMEVLTAYIRENAPAPPPEEALDSSTTPKISNRHSGNYQGDWPPRGDAACGRNEQG